MRNQSIEFINLPVSDLSQMGNPMNPRFILDEKLEKLSQSLDNFSCVEPVIVNKNTNQIVGGHQRVKAAIALGLESLPVALIEVTPEEETAFNLLLNKVKGEWDYSRLQSILNEVAEDDLSLTGFTENEIAVILNENNVEDTFEEDDDDEESSRSPFNGSSVYDSFQNRTEAEAEAELYSTVRVQFGMFTRHIPTTQYQDWVANLKKKSTSGDSPQALGQIVASMLNLDLAVADELSEDPGNESLEQDESPVEALSDAIP